MKFIKSLKIIDLIVSCMLIILFFYRYRITKEYEYGLGQLIELFIRSPVALLLLISVIMAVIAVCDKQYTYLFCIISQGLKIVAFLINSIITIFIFELMFKFDYFVLIAIYSTLILIILMIQKKRSQS